MAVQKNNTEIVIRELRQILEENLSDQVAKIFEQQDKMSEKFDRLQEAYTNLLARMVHVEAADFKTVTGKVDATLQQNILFIKQIEDLEDTNRAQSRALETIKSKLDRVSMIINIILGVIGLIAAPLLVAWISSLFPKLGG